MSDAMRRRIKNDMYRKLYGGRVTAEPGGEAPAIELARCRRCGSYHRGRC